ncbi:MAG: GTP-binding protein [Cyclobacteriaceae bacterium]|nr:GTP-binding protein [Cyclobacteriaceae bacterium]
MIPVHLILGFLGAGKTTFLKAVLKNRKNPNERILLIVNDYGQENYDAQILRQNKIEILEITNGCLCCSHQYRFEEVLQEYAASEKFDRIFIEPSGLFMPDQTIRAFRRGPLKSKVILQPVVTMIDMQFMSRIRMAWPPAIVRLIEIGQIIIKSKEDKLTAQELERVEGEIERLNSKKCYGFEEGITAFWENKQESLAMGELEMHEKSSHDVAFEFRKENLYFEDKKRLLEYFAVESGFLIRAKGNVEIGGEKVFINYVNNEIDIQPAFPEGALGLSCFLSKKEPDLICNTILLSSD